MPSILRKEFKGDAFTIPEFRRKLEAFEKKAKKLKASSTSLYINSSSDPSNTIHTTTISLMAYDN